MKFFCLCMSPAIDALVRLPAAPKGDGEIFKDVVDEENVGGKAINVARWLAIRGEQVACGGLLGEDNAALFEHELAKYGIEDRFIRVPGSTRRNSMVTWSGGSFKVNRMAFPNVKSITAAEVLTSVTAAEVLTSVTAAEVLASVIGMNDGGDEAGQTDVGADVAILSGSLPKCCAPSFYAECIKLLKAKGVKVVLDASGEALRLGVDAGPDLVKPNAEECEALVVFVPKSPDEFRRATEIIRQKCAHVIISDGAAGAWFDGEFVPAPKVDVVDTTSAGDTLLAEWCHSHDAHLAVAAGSAACTMPGSQPPDMH